MPSKESYAATLFSACSEVPTEGQLRWSASGTERKFLECLRSAIPSQSQPAERRPLATTADSCRFAGGRRQLWEPMLLCHPGMVSWRLSLRLRGFPMYLSLASPQIGLPSSKSIQCQAPGGVSGSLLETSLFLLRSASRRTSPSRVPPHSNRAN